MAKRGWRIVFWILVGILLIFVGDHALPRMPFSFLTAFDFERGRVGSHSPNVGSYWALADWSAVVSKARTELEAGGFHEVRGDERLTFRRGTGETEITVYLARNVTTAETARRNLPRSFPGRVAVYVDGIDQRSLLVKLLDMF